MSLFPKFVKETIPPANVAKPAKPNVHLSNFSRFSRGGRPDNEIDRMEQEYFAALSRFWSPATEDLPLAEVRHLVDRLDELYRELHQAGRKVPVRLPVERNRDQVQRGLAL